MNDKFNHEYIFHGVFEIVLNKLEHFENNFRSCIPSIIYFTAHAPPVGDGSYAYIV